jgi:hypothetical protein
VGTCHNKKPRTALEIPACVESHLSFIGVSLLPLFLCPPHVRPIRPAHEASASARPIPQSSVRPHFASYPSSPYPHPGIQRHLTAPAQERGPQAGNERALENRASRKGGGDGLTVLASWGLCLLCVRFPHPTPYRIPVHIVDMIYQKTLVRDVS